MSFMSSRLRDENDGTGGGSKKVLSWRGAFSRGGPSSSSSSSSSSNKTTNDDDDDDNGNTDGEGDEKEDENEPLSSSTSSSLNARKKKKTKKKKKETKNMNLTPARGSLWSPRRDSPSGTPMGKSSRLLMGHQREEEGEDVITQFLGEDEPREEEETSNIDMNSGSSSSRGIGSNATSTTKVVIKRNIFARFFGTCFGGANASSSSSCTSNTFNTKQQRNIREDAKAPLRKEEKAPTVAGCVPVPCLKPQFSNVVGEGFTLHTGAYFLPAPETYTDPKSGNATSKPCLVLDLDETLVHSSFRPVPNPDYIIPVEIDGKVTDVYVLKRPWVDLFLTEMAEKYELVVFTASLAKYANPLMDKLDVHGVVRHRLFRDACYPFQGNYVKDLTCLGRDLHKTIIIDNSPYSYMFHPQNALPVSSFIDDPADDALFEMLPHLYELAESEDVTATLYENEGYMPRSRFYPTRMDKTFAYDRLGNAI